MNRFVRIIYIALFAIGNAQEMKNLRVGDTVNLSKDQSSKVFISDIFNGFNGSHYIKTEKYSTFDYEKSYETCMVFESLKEYFYPKISIHNKSTDDAASKLFRDIDLWSDHYFNVNKMYVDNKKYRYGIVKLCKNFESQSLNIELINSTHFPKFALNGYYDILMNKTVVFRLKRDDETHYVSSLSTGTCLVQIYANDVKKCEYKDKNSEDVIDDFFKTSIYKTPYMSIDKDIKLEKTINEYYFSNNLDYSLYTFPHGGVHHSHKILDILKPANIVRMKLRPLPELPVVSKSEGKNKSTSRNYIKHDDIIPGTALNFNKLLDRKPRIAVEDFLMNTNDSVIPAFTTFSYSNCQRYTGAETPNFENEKFDIFETMLRRKNNGIDLKNPIEGKICLKFTVCAGLRKQEVKLPSSIVIKLNKNTKNNVNYNIFEEKNIVLWYSEGIETHFVRSTEKGECVSQTSIYPGEGNQYQGESIFDYNAIVNAPILSATGNQYLEDQVKRLVNYDLKCIFGYKKNITAMLKVFEALKNSSETRSALLNIYLYELF